MMTGFGAARLHDDLDGGGDGDDYSSIVFYFKLLYLI